MTSIIKSVFAVVYLKMNNRLFYFTSGFASRRPKLSKLLAAVNVLCCAKLEA